jgi:cellobionic acid phosphorylase
VAWVYRCLIEGLCGLKGDANGLTVNPQLPSGWPGMTVTRRFRGATFEVDIQRGAVGRVTVTCDGVELAAARIDKIDAGRRYRLQVLVP